MSGIYFINQLARPNTIFLRATVVQIPCICSEIPLDKENIRKCTFMTFPHNPSLIPYIFGNDPWVFVHKLLVWTQPDMKLAPHWSRPQNLFRNGRERGKNAINSWFWPQYQPNPMPNWTNVWDFFHKSVGQTQHNISPRHSGPNSLYLFRNPAR